MRIWLSVKNDGELRRKNYYPVDMELAEMAKSVETANKGVRSAFFGNLSSEGGEAPRLDNIITRNAFNADIDNSNGLSFEDIKDGVEALGYEAALFTTFSSSPDRLRVRVIIPFRIAVGAEDYPYVAERLSAKFREVLPAVELDESANRVNQVAFLAEHKPAAAPQSALIAGEQLDPTPWVLMRYKDLLESGGGASKASGPSTPRQAKEIPGPVGDFCREFPDIKTLRENLDGMRELILPGTRPGRWTLSGTSSQDGLSDEFGDGSRWKVHHESHFLHGRTGTMFDLAAALLYGAVSDGPPMARPETLALLERYDAHKMRVKIADVAAAPAQPWQIHSAGDAAERLARANTRARSRGKQVKVTADHYQVVLADSAYLQGLYSDPDLEGLIEHTPNGPEHVSYLMAYSRLSSELSEVFGLNLGSKEVGYDLLATAAEANGVYPKLRIQLESLQWDGVNRIETLIPANNDDEYVREALRTQFLSAANRALNPGAVMESTLVLYGPGGTGKTKFLESLAFDETLTPINGFNDSSRRQFPSTFIALMDEMAVLHTAYETNGEEKLKSELTAREDSVKILFRNKYAKFPRTMSFWGTTNNPKFIPPIQGARRFVPISVRRYIAPLTPAERDQIWAEAVHRVKAGEDTWFPDGKRAHYEALFERERREYTDLSGDSVVRMVFNTPVIPTGLDGKPKLADIKKALDQPNSVFADANQYQYVQSVYLDDLVMLLKRVGAMPARGTNSYRVRNLLSLMDDPNLQVVGSAVHWIGPERTIKTQSSDIFESLL